MAENPQRNQPAPSSNPLFEGRFLRFAKRLRPDLESMSEERRLLGLSDIIAVFYAAPLTLLGLIWLVLVTDWQLIREYAFVLLLATGLIVLFERFRFFLIFEIRENRFGSSDGSLSGIVLWSLIFIIGPTALWVAIILTLIEFALTWRQNTSSADRWNRVRNAVMNLAGETLVPLIALTIYTSLGGIYPLPRLNLDTVTIAFGTLLSNFVILAILWAGYLLNYARIQAKLTGAGQIKPVIKFFIMAIGLPHLAHPFAILAAGLFSQNGILIYLYFISGMLIVAYLARQLSWNAESSRVQSRLLQKIEELGRSIIDAPPDTESLPDILDKHLKTMFPAGRLVIWTFPDEILFKHPSEWRPELDQIWPWLIRQSSGNTFLNTDPLPWHDDSENHNPIVIAPFRDVDGQQPFGGIYLELFTLSQPWDQRALNDIYPAVQALAAQIASAMKQAKDYLRALEYQRLSEELKLAGSIQTSLLPHTVPAMAGWQFAVTLHPAGETSGDFFDIIPLSDGRIGLVIADVMDKGIGPALYMTLSRTLIRTYATEFDLEPDVVFFATNERILKDTRANLFVTAFYGVLDTETGSLTYCNAGHNPPYLFRKQEGSQPIALKPTGLPIGLDEGAAWESATINIDPGSVLVLYTDGIPEALNNEGQVFSDSSLVEVVANSLDQPIEVIQKSLLDAVYNFMGDIYSYDDITLLVLERDS
jgi:serine phosphatase RsbU (regulator of sigma subunit)